MALETRSIDERLARLEAIVESFREEVKTHLDRLEVRQESYFRWVMGTVLIMWATVIAVVLGALLTG